MWVGLLLALLRNPLLPVPVAVAVAYSDDGRRIDLTMPGEIQDPVRVFAPAALEVWINGEKMTCRRYGPWRLATFPILHNREACEPY